MVREFLSRLKINKQLKKSIKNYLLNLNCLNIVTILSMENAYIVLLLLKKIKKMINKMKKSIKTTVLTDPMENASIVWIQEIKEKKNMLLRNTLENVITDPMPSVFTVFPRKMRILNICLSTNTLIKTLPSAKCIDPIKSVITVW